MIPKNAQKLADALAAHSKLTTEEVKTFKTDIMAVVSPIKTQTAELLKWQEDVRKEMQFLD